MPAGAGAGRPTSLLTRNHTFSSFTARLAGLGSDYPFPLGEYTAESQGRDYCAGALVDSMAASGRAGWEVGGSTRANVLGGAALQWLARDEGMFRRMRG